MVAYRKSAWPERRLDFWSSPPHTSEAEIRVAVLCSIGESQTCGRPPALERVDEVTWNDTVSELERGT